MQQRAWFPHRSYNKGYNRLRSLQGTVHDNKDPSSHCCSFSFFMSGTDTFWRGGRDVTVVLILGSTKWVCHLKGVEYYWEAFLDRNTLGDQVCYHPNHSLNTVTLPAANYMLRPSGSIGPSVRVSADFSNPHACKYFKNLHSSKMQFLASLNWCSTYTLAS